MSKLTRTRTVFLSLHCFIFGLLAITPKTTLAQSITKEFSYKHYSVHDGLAQMQVMSLFVDSKGYLWCSTKAGLSRFDGNHFKNYPKAILPGFDLTVLGETKDQELLLFGINSFSELVGDSIHEHIYPERKKSSSLMQHSKRHKQKIVYSYLPNSIMQQHVLDYSNIDSLKLYNLNQKFGTAIFIEEGSKNYIWQSNNDTLYISDVKTGKLIQQLLNTKNISHIVQCGSYFVGYNDQHEVFQFKDDKITPVFSIPEQTRFFKIISTPANDALIIKTDKNLYIFKNELICIKEGLTHIRDIIFDVEENLWVATEEGLYNFFQLNFQNFKFNMGNKDWVWSVLEDDEHNFWFASYQNGLWKWDGENTTDYTSTVNSMLPKHLSRRPVPAYYAYYMGASKRGSTLFFPTECNVLKYDAGKFSSVSGLPELPYQMTKVFADGKLYCSGYPGLFILNEEECIKSWTREELGVSSVLNFELDKTNNLVVIGQNGLSVIENDSIIHYNDQNLLHSYSLAKDHHNNIWVAGIANINLYTNDSIKLVDSWEEEAFYSMLFVKPHFLFLGGIKGLYIADLEKYYNNGIFETVLFNQSNGFTGIESGQNGFLTDSEGMVWIPTSDLVTRFDPQQLIQQKIIPPRIYLSIKSSSDNIFWTAETIIDSEKKYKHNRNNLQFKIDAVSFTNSGNIRYYYRLNGLQENWSEATEVNEISYYNLSPGKYEFEVKADAGVSQATSEIIHANFTVMPPFWQVWWFVVIELILLMLTLFFLIQYFRKKEKNKAAIQQRLTQLRSEALAAQLDPHFVMNCLNNISGLVNAGLKKQANQYIVSFSKLLRVILQNVKKESISLSNEIEIVTKYMELEQLRCNHCFSFEIVLPKQYSIKEIMVPPIMLQPLVENSIKHGFAGLKIVNAHIKINLAVKGNFLYISILDNGRGMKTKSEVFGAGLGTKITRERIELLQKRRNIQFEINDRNPGAEVKFRIPLVIKLEHF
ncbi:histidine kinase [uncultured Draconibacterium sp.]|uniref:sensor histidine kinase n=1 Tax=uncultured Draconibacterium sp. TaxID=1573823 RepID=UPI0032606EC2